MSIAAAGRGDTALRLILLVIAASAIVIPAVVVRYAPPVPVARRHAPAVLARLNPRVVPAAELPPVEPVALVDLSPAEARSYNAAIPFSTDPNPAARPFRLRGAAEDIARATDCLAAAVVYEAGNDPTGRRAVAQVILNRLRHPAFPKTVCGVVFEGQERTTGCQFTFTCDGALARWTPSGDSWTAARAIATAALTGAVYRPVGYSTHYHTDWVVPYWQASLDKVAAVHTHLFFRWSGWWGTPPAFHAPGPTGEPVIAKLATISDAHRLGAALAGADAVPGDAAALSIGALPLAPMAGDPNSFLVALPVATRPETLPTLAAQACGDRVQCRFSVWSDPRQVPVTLPVPPQQIATMTFAYIRDRARGYEKPLWNCQQVPRPDRTQCMKVQIFQPSPVPTPLATPTPSAAPTKGVLDLGGVRRRGVPVPTPIPAPTPSPHSLPGAALPTRRAADPSGGG